MTIQITKKQARADFDAISFCVKAKINNKILGTDWDDRKRLQVKKGQMYGTNGHRLHWAAVTIPDGLYDYAKEKSTITLEPTTGNFPDVNKAIPKKFVHKVKVDNAELMHLCKAANIILDRGVDYNGIKLTFNGCLRVDAINPDVGKMDGETALNKPVDPELTIGVDVRYLIEALQGLDKKVTVGLQDNDKTPIIFKDKTNTALIMPIRL